MQFQVPGRMGLLITAYLITTNIYVNTIAPSTRGFSYYDIWITGEQIPIQIGIVQYGMLLTISRFCKGHLNYDRIDFISLCLTLFLSLTFDITYVLLVFPWNT